MKYSILLVDDEMATLGILAGIITRRFPDVVLYTAESGTVALEIFETRPIDLVIADINMAGMSGVQMTDRMRAIKADTRVIFLTGDSESQVMNGSAQKGFLFDQLIAKPVGVKDLFEAIDRCLLSRHNVASASK